MNIVHLMGVVGQDPELRHTTGAGQAVVNLTLATRETFNDKAGVPQERVEWHRLVCWGRVAELAAERLRKDSQVGIEGKLQSRRWRDQAGNPRVTTEVVVGKLHFLDDASTSVPFTTRDEKV